MEVEHFFRCPFCREHLSRILDVSEGGQSFVEECEACTKPMLIRYECFFAQLQSFAADAA